MLKCHNVQLKDSGLFQMFEGLDAFTDIFINTTKHLDTKVVDFVLHILFLIFKVFRSNSAEDIFIAVIDFFRGVFTLDECLEKMSYCKQVAMNVIRRFRESRSTESGFLDSLQGISKNLCSVIGSDLVECFKYMILCVLSLSIFEKTNIKTNITKFMGPLKAMSGLEMIQSIMECSIKMLSYGQQAWNGRSLYDIFISGDPVKAFLDDVAECELNFDMTYCGLPVDGKMCRRQYMRELTAAIENGKQLLEQMPVKAYQRKSVKIGLNKLKMAFNKMSNIMNASSRPMPFGVAIVGSPGIGKGLLIDYVARVWSHVKGREHSESMVYHRQATEDYWSGYEPASQPFIHYSEPGALHRDIAKSHGDPVMTEFLSVCDNAPFMCNMADLENKGKVYAMPEMVVLDTNDVAMNLDVIINNPAAVKRRLLYIIPRVKPEFLIPGTCRIDSKKSAEHDSPKLDRWLFDVFVMDPINHKDSCKKCIVKGVDIYELTSKLTKLYEEHIETQELRLKISNEISVTDYVTTMVPESGSSYAEMVALARFRAFDFKPLRESTYAFGLFGLSAFAYVGWKGVCALSHVVSDRTLAMLTRRVVQSRSDYLHSKCKYAWNRFKSTLGCKVKFEIEHMQYGAFKMVAALSATLVAWKMFRKVYTLVRPEMDKITTHHRMDENEVNTFLKQVEIDHQCCEPPPAKRRETMPQWESTQEPYFGPLSKYPANQIRAAVLRNLRLVTRDWNGKELINHALGICKDYALVNYHFLANVEEDIELTVYMPDRREASQMRVDLGAKGCYSEYVRVGGDLALVRLRGCNFRDIVPYFHHQHIIPKYFFGTKGYIGNEEVCVTRGGHVVCDSDGHEVDVKNTLTYVWSEHAPGKCGMPLFVMSGNATVIGGIHFACADVDDICSAESVTRKMLQTSIIQLNERSCVRPIKSEGYVRLPEGKSLEKIPDKSAVLYENIPSAIVHGSFGKRPFKHNSKLIRSKLFDRVEEMTGVSPFMEDGTLKFDKPPMSGKFVDGEWKAPYNHFLKKAGRLKKSLCPDTLNMAVTIVTEHVIKKLKAKGISHMSPVPLEVAMNGHPDNYYHRSVNLSTSSGWPWKAKKREMVEEHTTDTYPEGVMPIKELKDQIIESIRAYTDDMTARPLIGAHLKDEARSYLKCKERKTRVFYMSPFENLVLARMYLMPFFTEMVKNPEAFCTAIGINMHSIDVDKLCRELREFASEFFEGDYGGYDTSMPPDIGLAANTVQANVLEYFGYSEGAMKVVEGLQSDSMFPAVVMEEVFLTLPGLQVSGRYGTAEDNTLRGLIMLVYFWLCRCEDGYAKRFFEFVLPVIYGDDLIAAVKEEVKSWFNCIEYKDFCKNTYGIDFTPADKGSEFRTPLLKFEDLSFLKRNFRFNEYLNHWTAPLDKDSLMKTIAYIIPSGVVSEEEQICQACTSCLREFVLWDTPEEYETRRRKFAQVMSETYDRDANDYLKIFKTFDMIKRELYPEVKTEMAIRLPPIAEVIQEEKEDPAVADLFTLELEEAAIVEQQEFDEAVAQITGFYDSDPDDYLPDILDLDALMEEYWDYTSPQFVANIEAKFPLYNSLEIQWIANFIIENSPLIETDSDAGSVPELIWAVENGFIEIPELTTETPRERALRMLSEPFVMPEPPPPRPRTEEPMWLFRLKMTVLGFIYSGTVIYFLNWWLDHWEIRELWNAMVWWIIKKIFVTLLTIKAQQRIPNLSWFIPLYWVASSIFHWIAPWDIVVLMYIFLRVLRVFWRGR